MVMGSATPGHGSVSVTRDGQDLIALCVSSYDSMFWLLLPLSPPSPQDPVPRISPGLDQWWQTMCLISPANVVAEASAIPLLECVSVHLASTAVAAREVCLHSLSP